MLQNSQNYPEHTSKGGFYTVNLDIDGKKLPYMVFALSDYQAAHKVLEETGHAVTEDQVEGPYKLF